MFRFFKWLFGSKKSSPSDDKEVPAPSFEDIQQKKPKTLKNTEIRFLKNLLEQSIIKITEVREALKKLKHQIQSNEESIFDYTRKAVALIEKTNNTLSTADAEHLAAQALFRADELTKEKATNILKAQELETENTQLNDKIKTLRALITAWGKDAPLKKPYYEARPPKINENLASIDYANNAAIFKAMIERVEKATDAQEENVAEKLQNLLQNNPQLDELKRKIGLLPSAPDEQNSDTPPKDNPQ